MKFSDVVGIVTGGAGGLGRSFVEKILQGGGRVVFTDINKTLLEATGSELVEKFDEAHVAWMQQDVCDRDSFDRVFAFARQTFGVPCNLLVNNAGINGDLSFLHETKARQWEKLIEIDLISVMRGTQVALEQMREHLQGQPGVVVNVASGAGVFALDASPDYTAAKHGVVGLTRACAPQKASCNVRVVALCPMFAKTAMGDDALALIPDDVKKAGGLLEINDVAQAFEKAVDDDENAGRAIWISKRGTKYFPFPLSSTA